MVRAGGTKVEVLKSSFELTPSRMAILKPSASCHLCCESYHLQAVY